MFYYTVYYCCRHAHTIYPRPSWRPSGILETTRPGDEATVACTQTDRQTDTQTHYRIPRLRMRTEA